MSYLLEVVTQLDNRCGLEHSVFVDDQPTMTERVDVTLDQKQVRAALDRQEAFSGHVDAMCILEMLDRSTSSGLELDNGMSILGGFRVDNDIEFQPFSFHDTLES